MPPACKAKQLGRQRLDGVMDKLIHLHTRLLRNTSSGHSLRCNTSRKRTKHRQLGNMTSCTMQPPAFCFCMGLDSSDRTITQQRCPQTPSPDFKSLHVSPTYAILPKTNILSTNFDPFPKLFRCPHWTSHARQMRATPATKTKHSWQPQDSETTASSST